MEEQLVFLAFVFCSYIFTRAEGVAAKMMTMPMDTAKKHLQVNSVCGKFALFTSGAGAGNMRSPGHPAATIFVHSKCIFELHPD